ncbi:hypothetical protein LOTGIDRAFT_155018 [Lottia gigantea]|uniref:Uncharacterized protein n=1 Tax=Lottia gigantea TaxID=225164 RepID=V3ZMJ6_LOTGI|nr:hypothetical protein LOTGIDRAFT_155018 [Lottia gigantea]ESO85532.1 hypothetical protein LOTGIDRAFT_155018 [Lottia gigantea]
MATNMFFFFNMDITMELAVGMICDFKIKDGTQNQVPQTNTTLENNFFPSLFSEASSNPIETIKHPGEFDTMLKTVLYPKDFDSVLGWIPDVGDGSVLKEPVRNVANDADLDRVRVVARNTIERVARAANHGFEKRVLQYNDNNRWAAGAATGGISAAVKAANANKAADAKVAEERRQNLAIEKEARGSGMGDMIGTIKEFGKRFGEETKKTVKQGLNKLVDSIETGEVKVKHKEYLPKKDVQDLFQYYKENEEEVEIKDIIDNYIEAKNPTDIKVFLTKNVNDLDLSNIDSKRKNLILFGDCVA